MNIKKALAIIIASSIICASFSACSSKVKDTDATVKTTVAVEVTDADDKEKVTVAEDAKTNTIDLTDKQGNVLTVIPIYDIDGKTIIAGYIEAAKDKSGKALNQKTFKFIKSVIALAKNTNDEIEIVYKTDGTYTVIESLSDKNGYIIAMQDAIDVDKDKDVKEYFKVISKLDSNKNLFIRLEKDSKNHRINVKVAQTDDKKGKTVTDETGKTVSAVDTNKSQNIKDLTDKAKEETTKSTTKKPTTTKKATQTTKPTTTKPQVDYTSIVLKKNGQVDVSDNNVTITGNALEGGTEIKINGPGKYGKYYVTSETDSFLGQLEFDLNVGDEIEVKLNDVNISTQRKTALKFVNLDAVDNKESDAEESGSGLDQSGSSVASSAPEVQLSFTGKNSIKANGSGKNGSIYSECKLAIKGHGSADIDGGQSLSGICSTESITIKNATLNITSAAKQGISCDKKVTVDSGATINIKSLGDGIHCNRFVLDGVDADGINKDSVVNIRSSDTAKGCDGIDADEEITIKGGALEVTALTAGKYALKVRKVIKGSEKGIFTITGGVVKASGGLNTKPKSASQKSIYAVSTKATTFKVGDAESSPGAKAFVCSPANVSTVSSTAGVSKTVSWKSNVGSVVL